jgi:integrase
MRRPHIVPLSRQAIEILEEIRPHTGRGQYVFPGRTPSRPLSENGLGVALKTMGFTGEQAQTAHGFRSIASTNLNEQGWNRDVIERQLAHTEENSVRAAYNYADHLPERREMMQHYADWIDKLKADLLAS